MQPSSAFSSVGIKGEDEPTAGHKTSKPSLLAAQPSTPYKPTPNPLKSLFHRTIKAITLINPTFISPNPQQIQSLLQLANMIFTTAKAALALLCLAGYSSAFALPAALQSRENTQCYKVKEGSGCSLTADYGLYACSDNLWDVVSRQSLCNMNLPKVPSDQSFFFVTGNLRPFWTMDPFRPLRGPNLPLCGDGYSILLDYQ